MPRHDFPRKCPLPPIYEVMLDDKVYNMSFKIVTTDMKSLGLANNPYILKYPFNEYYELPDEWVVKDAKDWGGLWSRKTPSQGFWTVDYMKEKYDVETKIFLAAINKGEYPKGDVLYYNTTGIKSAGIKLFYKIHSKEHWQDIRNEWRTKEGLYIPK
ncbi:MAG: hypothetical protein ABIC91_03205 [Nanoarchaeota archaeon]|nr:hypothetical protein [Nanoarchaeota archaeon]MBU1850645.1 hypothetical protein [Nanoarchaeota archaeon]